MQLLSIKLITLLLTLFSQSSMPLIAFGSETDADSFGIRVVDILASENYDLAITISDSLIQADGSNPLGYFLLALTLNARSIDYEDYVDYDAFIVACDSVEALTKRSSDREGESPRLLYYLGTIAGLRAHSHLRSGSPFRGYFQSASAARYLEKAIKLDSTYWDAYLGLGLYYYHKSSRAGILRIAGLIGDRRSEGIELLKLTAEKGSYSSLPAISAYAWILIDEGEFEEAITISDELICSYPEARSFHWLLGKALKNSEQWKKAAEVYSKLLELVRNGERNNHFNEIGCLHSLALCYENLADYENVLSTTEDALKLQLTKSVKKRKSKDLKNLQAIRKHALECLEER